MASPTPVSDVPPGKSLMIGSLTQCRNKLNPTEIQMQTKLHEEVKITTNTSTAASTSSGNTVLKGSEGSRG
ncbi:hypothetical protein G5I_04141 [Acromyrmex echinatior]|uniref:Uncharacterized protein n=1 Tax=Acromyrmex echinatior TaxID=103372 RepID=F4WEU2_ACREC|nr:hypothetical protein G5I_04141 [Acromyrmex echinatior]